MAPPLVSVILPVWNRENSLSVSAGSVLAQSFSNLELIVVDDASELSLEPFVTALADNRVRYVRRAVRGGPAAARNTGLAVASGTYVAFQDSDDEWLLDKLDRQLAVIRNLPEQAFVLGSVVRMVGNNVIKYQPAGESSTPVYAGFQAIAHSRTTYTQGWLLPRYMFEAVGGFDEQLRVWEDYELLLRLAGSFQPVALPDIVALSVRREDSVTQDSALFAAAMCYIVEKHKGAFSTDKTLHAKLKYTCGRLLMAGRKRPYRHYLTEAIWTDPGRLAYWKLLLADLLFPERTSAHLARLNEAKR